MENVRVLERNLGALPNTLSLQRQILCHLVTKVTNNTDNQRTETQFSISLTTCFYCHFFWPHQLFTNGMATALNLTSVLTITRL